MAQNLGNKKLNWVSKTLNNAAQVQDMIEEALALRQEALDNGYGEGQTAITDALLNTGDNPPFPHLTAQNLVELLDTWVAINDLLAANTREGYKRIARVLP